MSNYVFSDLFLYGSKSALDEFSTWFGKIPAKKSSIAGPDVDKALNYDPIEKFDGTAFWERLSKSRYYFQSKSQPQEAILRKLSHHFPKIEFIAWVLDTRNDIYFAYIIKQGKYTQRESYEQTLRNTLECLKSEDANENVLLLAGLAFRQEITSDPQIMIDTVMNYSPGDIQAWVRQQKDLFGKSDVFADLFSEISLHLTPEIMIWAIFAANGNVANRLLNDSWKGTSEALKLLIKAADGWRSYKIANSKKGTHFARINLLDNLNREYDNISKSPSHPDVISLMKSFIEKKQLDLNEKFQKTKFLSENGWNYRGVFGDEVDGVYLKFEKKILSLDEIDRLRANGICVWEMDLDEDLDEDG